MVKVWYEPPPFGPRTSLNRSSYGISEASPKLLQRLAKAPQWQVMLGAVTTVLCLAYIPVMNQKLPHTFSPEYKAASQAYMRYHNMNPIYGVSSKEKRAADAGH